MKCDINLSPSKNKSKARSTERLVWPHPINCLHLGFEYDTVTRTAHSHSLSRVGKTRSN